MHAQLEYFVADATVDKIRFGESSPIINGGDAHGCLRGVFRMGATMSFGIPASAISYQRTLSED